MDMARFRQRSDIEWEIEPFGAMRVPGVIYASEALIRDMDDKVYEQVVNVASLPGIVKASYAMPDAHWGYGFPIGGVAAFDAVFAGDQEPLVGLDPVPDDALTVIVHPADVVLRRSVPPFREVEPVTCRRP